VSGNEAVLSVTIGSKSYVLGTLRKGAKEHLNLELRFWDILTETYSLSVTGNNVTVDLTGYFHPPEGFESLDDDDDFDEFDEEDDDDDDEELEARFGAGISVEDVTDSLHESSPHTKGKKTSPGGLAAAALKSKKDSPKGGAPKSTTPPQKASTAAKPAAPSPKSPQADTPKTTALPKKGKGKKGKGSTPEKSAEAATVTTTVTTVTTTAPEAPKTEAVTGSPKPTAETETKLGAETAVPAGPGGAAPAGEKSKKRGRNDSSGPTAAAAGTTKKAKAGGAFKCEPCGKVFGTETGFNAHKKDKHPNT
jgi:hypothetical protein